MRRKAIGVVAGILTAVGGIAIMLAGSDRPPPPGFLVVVVAAVALGVMTAILVPRMLGRAARIGVLRATLSALAVGAITGAGVALVFVIIGSGEPSTTAPGPPEQALFVFVVAVAGAIAGTVIAGLSLLLDRFSRSGPTPAGG